MRYRIRIIGEGVQLSMFEKAMKVTVPGSEEKICETLTDAVRLGHSLFANDEHKIVRTLMGCYNALIRRGEKDWCLGVSTKRAVYIARVK